MSILGFPETYHELARLSLEKDFFREDYTSLEMDSFADFLVTYSLEDLSLLDSSFRGF